MENISYLNKNNYQLRAIAYRLIMLILLSITIGSCYSIETDCVDIPNNPGPLPPLLPTEDFWELIPGSPSNVERMTCDVNGNLWAVTSEYSYVYVNGNLSVIPSENSDVYVYNGNSWQQRGSVGGFVNAIAVAPNGDIYTIGTVGDFSSLNRSTNGGFMWNNIFNVNKIELTEFAEIVISHSGEVYFATPNNVYVPNSNNWRRATTSGISGIISSPLALSPNGTLYAIERTSSLYYVVHSTDAGNSWLRSTGFSASMVHRLTVVDNNTIFVAAYSDGILKSTDGGQSWTQCCPTIPERTTSAFDIIYNSTMGELLAHIDSYTFTSNCDVLRSTDLGESWELRDSGLPSFRLLLGGYNFALSTNIYYLRSYLDANRVYRYICNP